MGRGRRKKRRKKEENEEWMKGTVAFTVRTDKEVFDYLVIQIKRGRFSSISEAVNTLLKEAIERRAEEE